MEQRDIGFVIEAHRDYPRKPSKAFRKWNGRTPYHIHPLWCATMLSTETALDDKTREEGAQALLYHDILEDTTRPLPDWLSPRVCYLIEQMTDKRGDILTLKYLWKLEPEVRLYKLYDKVSNLLDGCWMDENKRTEMQGKTRRLCEDAEKNYGILNIIKLAKVMLS